MQEEAFDSARSNFLNEERQAIFEKLLSAAKDMKLQKSTISTAALQSLIYQQRRHREFRTERNNHSIPEKGLLM